MSQLKIWRGDLELEQPDVGSCDDTDSDDNEGQDSTVCNSVKLTESQETEKRPVRNRRRPEYLHEQLS